MTRSLRKNQTAQLMTFVLIVATAIIWLFTQSRVVCYTRGTFGFMIGCGGLRTFHLDDRVQKLFDAESFRGWRTFETQNGWLSPWHGRSMRARANIFIPFWAVIVVVGISWFILRRLEKRMHRLAKHRAQAGSCIGCGYLLTGNESGICPECGATASEKLADGRF